MSIDDCLYFVFKLYSLVFVFSVISLPFLLVPELLGKPFEKDRQSKVGVFHDLPIVGFVGFLAFFDKVDSTLVLGLTVFEVLLKLLGIDVGHINGVDFNQKLISSFRH